MTKQSSLLFTITLVMYIEEHILYYLKSLYLFAFCMAWHTFFDVFRINSSAMRQTQISMTGLLLRTTRHIHRTHSSFGQSRPQVVGVGGHGSQSTRHDIFSWGHVVAWGLDFVAKCEMHGKNLTPISRKRCILEPKGAKIQCARRRD